MACVAEAFAEVEGPEEGDAGEGRGGAVGVACGVGKHRLGGRAAMLFGETPVLDAGAVHGGDVAGAPEGGGEAEVAAYGEAAFLSGGEVRGVAGDGFDTDGEDHYVGGDVRAGVEGDCGGRDGRGFGFEMEGDAVVAMELKDCLRDFGTELVGEGEFAGSDDGGVEAALAEGAGGFERDEAVADEGYAGAGSKERLHAAEVFGVADGEDVREVGAGDCGAFGAAARGEQKGVVGDGFAGVEGEGAVGLVEVGDGALYADEVEGVQAFGREEREGVEGLFAGQGHLGELGAVYGLFGEGVDDCNGAGEAPVA